MQNIPVEAFESDTHPEGGHVLLVLTGLVSAPARPRLRLKPIDPQASGDPKRFWSGASIVPEAAFVTARGLELVIGPAVVADALLLAGTPVAIEVPEMGLRGEFLWPDVKPPAQPKRRHVLVAPRTAEQVAVAARAPPANPAASAPIAAAASSAFTSEGPGEVDADLPPAVIAAMAAGGVAPARAGAPVAPDDEPGFPGMPAIRSPAPPLPNTPSNSGGATDRGAASGDPPGWRRDVAKRGTLSRLWLPAAATLAFVALVYGATDGRRASHEKSQRATVAAVAAPARATAKPPSTIPAGASDATAPAMAAADPAQLPVNPAPPPCADPAIATEALDAGMMRLSIVAPCRPNQRIAIAYDGVAVTRVLDDSGSLTVMVDSFAEATTQVEITFADGLKRALAVATRDLDTTTKVALVWRAPVELDLHAFEYAASHGEKGHVWSKAPSSLAAARAETDTDRRAHGFVSTSSGPDAEGDRVEVFTLLHAGARVGGSVALAIDYASRGEVPAGQSCGKGSLAEVTFTIIVRTPSGQVTRQAGQFAAAPCGERLSEQVRYLRTAMPVLKIRK